MKELKRELDALYYELEIGKRQTIIIRIIFFDKFNVETTLIERNFTEWSVKIRRANLLEDFEDKSIILDAINLRGQWRKTYSEPFLTEKKSCLNYLADVFDNEPAR